MPQFLERLPDDLESGEAILKRRDKAKKRKELWRSLFENCYRFAMPTRELFNWYIEGQVKNQALYDSTLQDATYEAANTMSALLFPPWSRWTMLAPGGEFPRDKITPEVLKGMQEITQIFFDFLNHSNFVTVANEVALDLMVGTGALRFDEGEDNDNPFVFSATPLAAIELEEGPNGAIETVFMCRKLAGRNLIRTYVGMEQFDLPAGLATKIAEKPDEEIEVVQGTIYHHPTRRYYGVVVWVEAKTVIWRYDYGQTSPDIVPRASKIAGELYGRGRVMMALADAMSLDEMEKASLQHLALQLAPPMTGVSDGVLNPYTAVLSPNTILPVASNDTRNPSLAVLDFGGNFNISDAKITDKRDRVRRIMLGPEPSEGPVKSATEHSINDRNRLWAMGGEYGRIQVELLVKVVNRGLTILQSRGLIPKFKIDGRVVTLRFTSPFARSQDADDLLAFDQTMQRMMLLPGMAETALDVDALSEWLPMKSGLDMRVVNDKAARKELKDKAAAATLQAAQMAQEQGQMPA